MLEATCNAHTQQAPTSNNVTRLVYVDFSILYTCSITAKALAQVIDMHTYVHDHHPNVAGMYKSHFVKKRKLTSNSASGATSFGANGWWGFFRFVSASATHGADLKNGHSPRTTTKL